MSNASATATATAATCGAAAAAARRNRDGEDGSNGDIVGRPPPRSPTGTTTTNGRKRAVVTVAAATVTPSSSLSSLGGGGVGGVLSGPITDDHDTPRTTYARAAATSSSCFGVNGDDDDESDFESSSSLRRRRRRNPQHHQPEQQDAGEVAEEEEDGKLPAKTMAKSRDTDSDSERGVRRTEVSQDTWQRGGEDGKPYARREGGATATNGVHHERDIGHVEVSQEEKRRREEDDGETTARRDGGATTRNEVHHASSASAAAASSIDDHDPSREAGKRSSLTQAEQEEEGRPLSKGGETMSNNGGHHTSMITRRPRHGGSSRKRAAPASASAPVVRIVSATYGPEDGRRLLNGDVVSHADQSTTLPNRRDVLPVLRALLIAHDERRDGREETWGDNCTTSDGYDEDGIGSGSGVAIMDGKSMNVVFGDPCPGTTKRLDVTYVFDPPSAVFVSGEDGGGKQPAAKLIRGGSDQETPREDEDHDDRTQLCRSSFAEHERVVLRRRTRAVSDDDEEPMSSAASAGGEDAEDKRRGPSTSSWRLCPGTSEIVLPIVLPYLDLRRRVLCSEVCVAWRRVVSDWGVARRVDVSDPSFSKYVDSRRFLRGVIKSSYGSLRSLFLNNYSELERQDFEAAVPHLRTLRTLDVSRCRNLNDETMTLVAEHLGGTLEVLYVKGLRRVGDVGIVAVSEGCPKLRVLEISQVPLTDVGGVAIGTNLLRLEALYMRDNFKLTNRSVDVITSRCDRLEQLTLWGCTKLRGLRFEDDERVGVRAGMRNVVLLNLWGCHGLGDDAALRMASLRNLRILIASECHRLSDKFVVNLVRTVPHIQHLHLRYLRRITDAAVDAVATGMPDLATLDLSFCTAITAPSLANLLDLRRRTLSELRLFSCRRVGDGRGLLRIAGAVGRDSVLDVLDLRRCHVGGDDGGNDDRDRWGGPDGVGPDVVRRLTSPSSAAALGFSQPLPGFFVRPAVWNGEVRRRLVGQQVDAGRFG